ncbi:MAG: DUF814 domain-containing protein [Bdellovibrionales bacterium]|nr:DUF814 domain-containing protein [Bdellovibrionales bacterium]
MLLNWREISELVRALAPRIEGAFVDRLLVPERPRYPERYLKGEWAVRLTHRRGDSVLVFSVRPRATYLCLEDGKGPRASERGTRSPFDLAVNKRLKGARLESIRAVPRDRSVVIRFLSAGEPLLLVIFLIPATPEAVFGPELPAPPEGGWRLGILAHTRKSRLGQTELLVPATGDAPESALVRPALVESPEAYSAVVHAALGAEAFALRSTALAKHLREARKDLRKRAEQSEGSAAGARAEQNWQALGKLLTAHLHTSPTVITPPKGDPYVELEDFETGAPVRVPLDPKLGTLAEQAERLFQLGRRKKRREEASSERGTEAGARASALEAQEAELAGLVRAAGGAPSDAHWAGLEALEKRSGLATLRELTLAPSGAGPATKGPLRNRKPWTGRSFMSEEGLPIWAGKSSEENLELTFKFSRGADVWMHVRGRPGAHLLVPLPPGRTASLDTLLDAANLAIHLSGGQNWGKTDVDYAPVKNVKRIKGSTEVQYSGNKTLSVTPDPARLKRLLGNH